MHMRGWDNVPFKLEPKCKFKVKRLQDQNYSTKQYISSPVDLGAPVQWALALLEVFPFLLPASLLLYLLVL